MTPNPPPNPWQAADRIYCITLAERPDRRRAAESQFAAANLADRLEFLTVPRHPANSEQGIFESHLQCLRLGLAAGARTILIFEDDVQLTPAAPASFSRAAPFLAGDSWDLLFLGCFVKSSRRTPHPGILQIRYRATTHAYIICRPFAEKLVQSPWQNIPYDDFLRTTPNLRAFTLYPAIAFQSDSASDNQKTQTIDRTRRLFGGLRRLQRFNELTHHHMLAIILTHLLAAALFALLLYLRYARA